MTGSRFKTLCQPCEQPCPECSSRNCCPYNHRFDHEFSCKTRAAENGLPIICRHRAMTTHRPGVIHYVGHVYSRGGKLV
jgi:hypothetical protein